MGKSAEADMKLHEMSDEQIVRRIELMTRGMEANIMIFGEGSKQHLVRARNIEKVEKFLAKRREQL